MRATGIYMPFWGTIPIAQVIQGKNSDLRPGEGREVYSHAKVG